MLMLLFDNALLHQAWCSKDYDKILVMQPF